jgi:hypothetical protein
MATARVRFVTLSDASELLPASARSHTLPDLTHCPERSGVDPVDLRTRARHMRTAPARPAAAEANWANLAVRLPEVDWDDQRAPTNCCKL